MERFLDVLLWLLMAVLFFVSGWFFISEAFSAPEVYFSYSTNECKYIVWEGGKRTGCENLKDLRTYDFKWTK